MGLPQGIAPILVVAPPEHPYRRQPCKPLAKALYAAALVVDRDQKVRIAEVAYRTAKSRNLLWIPIVTGEENDASDQGVLKDLQVLRGQFGPGDIDHERAQAHVRRSNTATDS